MPVSINTKIKKIKWIKVTEGEDRLQLAAEVH